MLDPGEVFWTATLSALVLAGVILVGLVDLPWTFVGVWWGSQVAVALVLELRR